MITAIAAVTRNWGIGKDGDLLFHIPEDKKFFRRTTINHTVIMGRKTLESLPNGKPFKDRSNVVFSRNTAFAPEGVTVIGSIDEAVRLAEEKPDEEIFVVGGGEIYRAMLPYCQKALITKIDAETEADTFFPNLDEDPGWTLSEQSEKYDFEGTKYSFCTYISVHK